MTIESSVVENVGVAIGISLLTQSSPEIKRTSGLRVAIFIPGRRQAVVIIVLDNVGIVTRTQAL